MERTKASKIFKECADELERKALEYGDEIGKDYEVMALFRNRKPTQICFDLMLKHFTVLGKIADEPEKYNLKLLRHRIMDLINFCIIFEHAVENFKISQGKTEVAKNVSGD